MAQRSTPTRRTQVRKTSSRATPARKAGARKASARRAAAASPPVAIRSRIPLEPAFRDRVRAALERKLRKFARHVERVSVRFEDVNGPRGGVDTLCRAKAVLRRLPTVVVEAKDANEHAAFQEATRSLERAVRREASRIVTRKRTAAAR